MLGVAGAQRVSQPVAHPGVLEIGLLRDAVDAECRMPSPGDLRERRAGRDGEVSQQFSVKAGRVLQVHQRANGRQAGAVPAAADLGGGAREHELGLAA